MLIRCSFLQFQFTSFLQLLAVLLHTDLKTRLFHKSFPPLVYVPTNPTLLGTSRLFSEFLPFIPYQFFLYFIVNFSVLISYNALTVLSSQ